MNGDDDYIPPSSGRASRPSYASQFKTVGKKQDLKRSKSGTHWTFKSVVDGTIHKLDSKMRERVPHHRYPKGKLQRPALDHEVKYANLKEQYKVMVHRERRKSRGTRRSSIDLSHAFADAVRDPENLSIKTHSEHSKTGRSLKTGHFPASRQRKAHLLLEKHFVRRHTQSQSEKSFWHSNRPSYAVKSKKRTTTYVQVRSGGKVRRRLAPTRYSPY